MEFRDDINGLRAIAVIVVVLFHFDVSGFTGGFIGVDIFFVISGYLMTSIILKKHKQSTFTFYSFYLDRVKRIVPALLALCVVLIIVGWFLLIPSDFRSLAKQVGTSLGFVSNIFYFLEAGYFDAASHDKLLLHTWSLSIEWQFYLLYPIFISLIYKLWGNKYITLGLWMIVILSFLLLIYTPTHQSSSAFFLLHCRLWELAVGGLVFTYSDSKILNKRYYYLGIFLIFISVVLIDDTYMWPSWLTLLPVIGTCLVILAAQKGAVFTNNPIFNQIGKISYSVYLWHWPIVVTLIRLDLLHSASWIAFGIALSLFLGQLSYLFIEQPAVNYFRTNGKVISSRYKPWTIISGVIVCVGFSVIVFFQNGFPSRVPMAVYLADNERHNGIYTETSNIIKASESVRNSDVILIGDSFAAALSGTFREAMKDIKHTAVIQRGCPTVRDAEQRDQLQTEKCSLFTNTFFDLLTRENFKSRKKIVVINSFGYWNSNTIWFKNNTASNFTPATDSLFIEKLVEGTCQLQQKHDIYFMLPIPSYTENIPSLIANYLMWGKPIDSIKIDLEQHKHDNRIAYEALLAAKEKCNITLLDPTDYLCLNGNCDVAQEDRPLYYDATHLSRFGAARLLPVFETIKNKQVKRDF